METETDRDNLNSKQIPNTKHTIHDNVNDLGS
jgi:hypothetical protein